MTDRAPRADDGPARQTQATYCRICEPACGLLATTENGRLVDLGPNRDHLLSQGFMCVKGRSMVDVVNDPDRVLQPMRRVGPPGCFEPVSWDDAIADIGARLKKIRRSHGPRAFAISAGNPPAFDYSAYMWLEGFQKAVGSPWKFGVNAEDAAARQLATMMLYGSPAILMMPDWWHTDFAVLIGANPFVSHGSQVTEPRVRDALRSIVNRGGRVVIVDPRRTETARHFEHFALHAGSDAWLLGAIVHVLLAEGLVDEAFVARWTRNIDDLRAAVQHLTPERAAQRCGCPPDRIVDLARSLGSARSAVVYGRTGTCTQGFGTLNNFLQDVINILTGNLDSRGGWLFPWGPVDFAKFAALAGLDTYGKVRSQVSNLPDVNGMLPSRALAEDIMAPGGDRIRALCSMGTNPVLSSAGGGDRLEAALEQLDLHFSIDLYQNETNQHAHYLLPATTMYEREDLPFMMMGNMLRPTVFATKAVIPPRGQCRPEWRILNQIARAAGLGGAYSFASLRWLAKIGIEVSPRTLVDALLRTSRVGDLYGLRRGGISITKMQRNPNGIRLRDELPTGVIGQRLRTADRRINLAPEPILEELTRLAATRSPDHPLRLTGMRETHTHNTWMHNSKRLVGDGHVQKLRMHPDDAQAVGLRDGDRAAVRSPAATLEVVVEVTDEMFPGNVALPHGWGHSGGGGWHHANALGGANSNSLAGPYDGCVEPLAGMSVLNGIPVTVKPVEAAAEVAGGSTAHSTPAP
ncbi:molybdopterin-containing oxidoreductase family protein [Mycolicibacterium holsaticum]|uniref:molybdopterin-containing oxidoreductase family protein n=1 Tax=Mycolicibacterium holsaticum TaxID=152142 RepID=UPI001C7DE5DD|nr:molybdopterin-dependent oxidoreductase [Mycolicibacterium holsaticum]MDA4109231.1 formate dehydrogenase [Mycolicibacterium holsaticum DSM 44478 = JCM 12374]QZA11627.1 molybdopterin-dependent oxidoreductase [Mycolicibacterium holsaticum DSM 44478 = JCM 12374]UNC10885.1 molybdopterin-dependent oxidoreductase [Mycolicibacterium holsaticum DSM 44478 = JCM 12374]